MYPRVKTVRRGDRVHEYLHLVECRREDGKPVQRFVRSLGRIESREERAHVQDIAYAILRFLKDPRADEVRPLAPAEVAHREGRSYGAVAAIAVAWRAVGLDRIIEGLAESRRYGFSLERAVFAMVANRLCDPRSKLSCAEWLARDVYLPCGKLDADQLYEALSWLEEAKPRIEEALYRSLCAEGRIASAVVFHDTTATWFEGRGPTDLANFGRPKAGQPRDRRLILISLTRSREGWPITHRVFPGNTNDHDTVKPTLADFKERFGVRRVIWISDRGMYGEGIVEALVECGYEYIMATPLRTEKEVCVEVLGRQGRYHRVADNLEVKEVSVDDRRYIVCRNLQTVERDAARRRDILGKLGELLARSDRADTKRAMRLLVNKAYGRYLSRQGGRLVIDRDKVNGDARFDGKWVLRTNLDRMPSDEIGLLYKEESRIEWDFRDIKTFYELRPIYHRKRERVEGHVFVCILAKICECELRRRMHQARFHGTSIDAVLEELGRVRVAELAVRGHPLWIHTDLTTTQIELKKYLALPDETFPTRLPMYEAPTPRKVRVDNGSIQPGGETLPPDPDKNP